MRRPEAIRRIRSFGSCLSLAATLLTAIYEVVQVLLRRKHHRMFRNFPLERLMNHYADTQPRVIRGCTRDDEWRPDGLERCWHKYNACLLVAAGNDIPIDLNRPDVDAVV